MSGFVIISKRFTDDIFTRTGVFSLLERDSFTKVPNIGSKIPRLEKLPQ